MCVVLQGRRSGCDRDLPAEASDPLARKMGPSTCTHREGATTTLSRCKVGSAAVTVTFTTPHAHTESTQPQHTALRVHVALRRTDTPAHMRGVVQCNRLVAFRAASALLVSRSFSFSRGTTCRRVPWLSPRTVHHSGGSSGRVGGFDDDLRAARLSSCCVWQGVSVGLAVVAFGGISFQCGCVQERRMFLKCSPVSVLTLSSSLRRFRQASGKRGRIVHNFGFDVVQIRALGIIGTPRRCILSSLRWDSTVVFWIEAERHDDANGRSPLILQPSPPLGDGGVVLAVEVGPIWDVARPPL